MSSPAPTVLNVDDNEARRYAKSRILKQGGYQVIEPETGADALRVIKEANPSLVLLDVKLPDTTGFAVCEAIKADPSPRTSWFYRFRLCIWRLRIGLSDWRVELIPI